MSRRTVLTPELEVKATAYSQDGSFEAIEPNITPVEAGAMNLAMIYANDALHTGNPPVGAFLVDNEHNHSWGQGTNDHRSNNLLDHAEIIIYQEAQPVVGRDLSNCTLVTTADPCVRCASIYAEGGIGKIIVAAQRDHIRAVSGKMRKRNVNLSGLLEDGATDTVLIQNFQAVDSLRLFARHGKTIGHKPPAGTPKFLLDIYAKA